MTWALIIGGLALLFVGGEILVRGSVGVARKLGVSDLIIGLTLVGFGTSLPELVTSLQALNEEAVGIAVGNVVGSNISNILLVLGMAALIAPFVTQPAALARDTGFMILVTVAFGALIWFDLFSRPVGLVMVTLLVVYVMASFFLDRRPDNPAAQLHAEESEVVKAGDPLPISLILAFAGMAGVIFGARFLVDGGIRLAGAVGLSEAVVGLSIVAVGTSLPELATSIISAMRGKADVALGNVIGSNIFNMLGIIGVSALVKPFSVLAPQPAASSYLAGEARSQGLVNLPIIGWEHIGALILSVFLLLLFAFTEKRMERWEGLVLLLAYGIYMGMLFEFVPTPFTLPL
ncbi:MAG: calcium/sodium antiporter [Gammaproteobacteria bacterium]|jgi:cation:H+ antiporter|nr:calcium/sodium antiporter [Gammaproteobacteria bacterium]